MEDLQRECDLVGVLSDTPVTIKVNHRYNFLFCSWSTNQVLKPINEGKDDIHNLF